jgi:hypothetical protein
VGWTWKYLKADDREEEGSADLLVNVVNSFITSYVNFFEFPDPIILHPKYEHEVFVVCSQLATYQPVY